MKGKTIQELTIGDVAQFSKTISESDIYLYAGISGDTNPAHLDEEYAKQTMFKGRIAHGMLSAGLISAVLGMQLPGPGAIYLKQSLAFLKPVRIGDTITASAEVTAIDLAKNRLTLHTTCRNQAGELVIDGEALVLPPKAL